MAQKALRPHEGKNFDTMKNNNKSTIHYIQQKQAVEKLILIVNNGETHMKWVCSSQCRQVPKDHKRGTAVHGTY